MNHTQPETHCVTCLRERINAVLALCEASDMDGWAMLVRATAMGTL